ncbi:MAG: 16S rRNA (adenine(1518)-N(6)/adenine(1519)-N(6))-dimethyltransferase RsmA [Saprospiraceae bacterium]|nr:16S rRNA (adenine(1518)-N(6)/adenine(1519)-N(6))-dimethyltransferase RsmA [Saprospiraceae bacterium]MBP7699130.1 16S rRNA (adenine(1518)-N(6)/adenine(1519)-N(6))-dimethyltransferase RsmA [Saprospiraceae bacterium]
MKAKKSYGQHFLHDEHIAERIAASLIHASDYEQRVVEVGPGMGMLTKYLMLKNYDIKAVEADADMVAYLQQNYPNLRVTYFDFLKYDLQSAFDGKTFGLIGNFPYNISSQIVFRMIEHRQLIPEMVGMFQREMAERIIAKSGGKEYGIISVLTQAYYDGGLLFTLGRGAFTPPPNVQSAVIRLTRKENYQLPCDEVLLRKIVKQSFNQRRKMLRNTLADMVQNKAILEQPIFTKRPEALSVAAFVELTQLIAEK